MEAVNVNKIKYLIWLNCYTMNHKEITDSTIPTNKLTQIDISNLYKLEELYKAVDEYAKDNLIMPIVTEYETYYCIEYWGAYYVIGNRFHIENENYCIRIDEVDNAINMCEVLDYQASKNQELTNLTRTLKATYEI